MKTFQTLQNIKSIYRLLVTYLPMIYEFVKLLQDFMEGAKSEQPVVSHLKEPQAKKKA